jgi:hypothetical protein
VQQAYQHTLVDDVAAAPVIDSAHLTAPPITSWRDACSGRIFPRPARERMKPSAEAMPVRLGLASGHHDRGNSSVSGDELHSSRFATTVCSTAFGSGGLRT